MRSHLASVAIAFVGAALLWSATDGLRAFTSEQARRLDVRAHPRTLPDPLLHDQLGRPLRLSDFRGQPLLVDFIYTNCTTLCGLLSASLKQFADREVAARAGEGYLLLSISFDPDRDTPAVLEAYARRYGADPQRWRFARVADKAALGELLRAFGVVVIRDASGEFQHNGAIHLVNRSGHLVDIFDYGEMLLPRTALREAQ